MTTPDMINLIRANTQPLSQKTLQAIADRLEEQHAYLRSCLCTIDVQEEQLRGLGGELAESERHRQILTEQNKELLGVRKTMEALEAALAPLLAWDDAERRASIIMGPAEIMLESLGCTVVAEDFDRIRQAISHCRDAEVRSHD